MTEYRADQHFQALLSNYTVLLKDGETTATIYPIYNSSQLPPGLLAFLADEFNVEVERGDSFPFFDALDFEEFKNYWFGSFAAVMVLGDDPQLDHQRQWEKECLGTFFMRSNFPGRSSHICTGAFLVNAGIRGKGIGRTLAECYLDWAPKLGYTSSVFNLVYESNVGARRIFEVLNFKRIGKIKAAGILKDHNQAVDALIYGQELVSTIEQPQGTYRFDKIRFYLETGKYPPSLDRQEKSRLRSSAAHYKLENGRLYLKGKEVIGDLAQQLEICGEYHRIGHGGINKTTSAITEKYHWSKIKDTVAQTIRNCPQCRNINKYIPKKNKGHKETTDSTTNKDTLSVQTIHEESNHIENNGPIISIGSHSTQSQSLNVGIHGPGLTQSETVISSNRASHNNAGSVTEPLTRVPSHFERPDDLVYTDLEEHVGLDDDDGISKFQRYQEITQNQGKHPGRQDQPVNRHEQDGRIERDNANDENGSEGSPKDPMEKNQHTVSIQSGGNNQQHGIVSHQAHDILSGHMDIRKRTYNDMISSPLYQEEHSPNNHQEPIDDLLLSRSKLPHIDLQGNEIGPLDHDSRKDSSLHDQIIQGYDPQTLEDASRYYDGSDTRTDVDIVLDSNSAVFSTNNTHLENHTSLRMEVNDTEDEIPGEIEIARALIQANEEQEEDEHGVHSNNYFKSHR